MTKSQIRELYLKLFFSFGIPFGILFTFTFFSFINSSMGHYLNYQISVFISSAMSGFNYTPLPYSYPGFGFLMQKSFYLMIITAFISFIGCGANMSLILGKMHISAIDSLPYKNIKDLGTNQERFIELDVSYDKAFNLCLSALEVLNNPKICRQDYKSGKIKARTTSSRESYGEIIEFEIKNLDNLAQIRILSKPRFFSTLIDYGKNIDNVEKILEYIKQGTVSC